ncbi:MAG: hypothetical protein KGI57_08970 [Hyphomicrobiales bacterium]|nr:hypothetical protein [Hyphomicrobiales bacterium]
MVLGCIGDGFAPSVETAAALSREGLRTIVCGAAPRARAPRNAEAAVVAVDFSATAPDTIRQAFQALDWLGAQGVRQVLAQAPASPETRAALAKALLERLAAGAREDIRVGLVGAAPDPDLAALLAAAPGGRVTLVGADAASGAANALRPAGRPTGDASRWRGMDGPGVAIAGSGASATLSQVAHYGERHPTMRIDPEQVMLGRVTEDDAARFALDNVERSPLIHSSTSAALRAGAAARWGETRVARTMDWLFGQLAQKLVDAGVTRLVVAGDGTAAAVAEATRRATFEIGPEIGAGAPALIAQGDPPLALVVKRGGVGARDFFETALAGLAA